MSLNRLARGAAMGAVLSPALCIIGYGLIETLGWVDAIHHVHHRIDIVAAAKATLRHLPSAEMTLALLAICFVFGCVLGAAVSVAVKEGRD